MRNVTLGFLIREDEILLALKKRGFGMGHMNGIGGGIEEGETSKQAMVREANEEIGVTVDIEDAEKVGEFDFNFDKRPEWHLYCHVFLIKKWEGEPKESDEMAPEWFPIEKIPYEKMWCDDVLWLHRVIMGERLKASFLFSYDGSKVLEHDIKSVSDFSL